MAHALIFGASGISGWSLLNQTRVYPSETAFKRITGITNRPLALNQALIAEDERIKLVSGIDLRTGVEEVVAKLQDQILDVATVTHVFFTAYIEEKTPEKMKITNTHILEVAIQAAEKAAPNLKTFILQTGGNGYGLEFPDQVQIKTPLSESFPRIPEPWASKVFYYAQHDLLVAASRNKKWTFSEIRPEVIVGFSPSSNFMNLAQGLGALLSLYKEVKGAGTSFPFPGTLSGDNATFTDTSQDILAKMEIFAALNPDTCGKGAIINIADGPTMTWAQLWPRLCEHFGLIGTGPQENNTSTQDFVSKHKDTWLDIAKRHGLSETVVEQMNWAFIHFVLVDFAFDRDYDLTYSRKLGFTEKVDTVQSYITAWERMRQAKILPPRGF
ncbi:unnamed protein product [Clonostachys rhizophaga]|uniref:PRISE-like Rossmann-fold domain-containing protein n=1 Tax=Clonostachys rhizophaga TaxID=160324 RepID=A0A9N9VQR6_9HYPO|nr:unnamed protein product [Clonostachys rhizophaga]